MTSGLVFTTEINIKSSMNSDLQSIHQKFVDAKAKVEAELGESLSISGLCGPLRIFQRLNGHRHSIDDATTAWYALRKAPDSCTALDLGSGIGSVGLAVLWGLPAIAKLICVEAQEISFKLLKANVACNNLQERVRIQNHDLRDLDLNEKFDLITGSPPYFSVKSGVLPKDLQKLYARFEMRGDVGDYAKAAKRHLKDDGTFVFCFPFQQKSRALKLVQEQGFAICSVQDVVPTLGKTALFSLYSAKIESDSNFVHEPDLIVLRENGKYTDQMLELQCSRGFGDLGTNDIGLQD